MKRIPLNLNAVGFGTVFVVFVLTLVFGASTANAQARADHILENGKVLTVDRNFSITESIAITGDRISAVGTNAEVRRLAGPNTKVTDLGGKTVIPGLIDNHNHYVRGLATWPMEVRLDTVTSHKKALEMISARVKSLNPGEWILVIGGWQVQQFLDDPRGFTQVELDEAAPNNPVFIQIGFSNGVANSLALKTAGVKRNQPPGPPPGAGPGAGSGARRARSASPFGGGFAAEIKKALPELTAERWKEFLSRTNEDYNRAGVTAVWEASGFVGPAGRDRLKWTKEFAETQGWLGVRMFYPLKSSNPRDVSGMIQVVKNSLPDARNPYFAVHGLGEVNIGPLFDMVGRGFIRARQPGSLEQASEQFKALAMAAAEKRMSIIEHTMVPEKYDLLLTMFEEIDKSYDINPLRWRFDHNYGIKRVHMDRAKVLGITLGMHTTSALAGGAGPRMGPDTPPFKTAQESGIVWGLGTDTGIVAPWHPFFTLSFAVTGKNAAGKLVNKTEKVSRKEALIAATRSNAYILLQEKNLGSIEVGKYADLVVLNKDYLTIPEDEIKTIESVLTLVGGRVGYKAKN